MENGNSTNETSSILIGCSSIPPSTQELFRDLPVGGYVLYSFLLLFFLITLAIYIEEIVFILKHFRISLRKKKTIWILALHSVFSGCGLIGCIVPRSGTLIDMVSNLYFGTCLYNFGRLLINYMGGGDKIWQVIGPDRRVPLHTPPLCCCCVCLPPVKLTRSVFFRISLAIMQVAIVRPILMFFAAVMWANGSYNPGQMQPSGAYMYFTIVNAVSSVTAVYGLMLLRGAFRPELERDFHITGKIFSIQLVLVFSAIPNMILGILVSTGVIPCGPIFPSEARAEAIYHCILVMAMLPFCILARHFFRRKYDGYGSAGDQRKAMAAVVAAASAAAAAPIAADISRLLGTDIDETITSIAKEELVDDDDDHSDDDEDDDDDEEDTEEEEKIGGSYSYNYEDINRNEHKPVLKWPSETKV